MRDKITVIGSLNYDIILKIGRLPQKGETLQADDAAFSAGGKGANQAVQAAKLGAKTYMVGAVGSDTLGDFLIETAKNYGVDTSYVKRTEGISGMGVVNAVEDGSVFATIVKGANFEVTKEDIDAAEALLTESEIVILQMEIPMDVIRYAMDKAKACGCKVLLNAAPALPFEDEYLAKADILVLNEVEAGFYTGEVIDSVEKAEKEIAKLSKRLHNDCIFTLGSMGAVVCEKGEISFIPCKKVNAVETTGAGDSYIGATAYSMMQGKNLKDACTFATKCSAITVCRYGAQPSMPTLAEVENA